MKKPLLILLCLPFLLLAQPQQNNIQSITTDLNGSFSVNLEENQIDAPTILREFNSWVNLSEDHTFEQFYQEDDNIGFTHIKYKQVYKGIPIDGGILMVHIKDNTVNSINGRIVRFDDIDLSVNISKANALEIAKLDLKVTNLTQEYPVETLIRSKNKKGDHGVHLVHKVKIMSFTPMAAFDVFIDAKTGEIVSKISLSSNADVPGTVQTYYNGAQPITCFYYTSFNDYSLDETGRNIETRDATNSPWVNFPFAADYITSLSSNFVWDPNNLLVTAAAADAHWGMEKTYDFYLNTFGRDSYDNQGGKIRQYINPPSMQGAGNTNNAGAYSDGIIGGTTYMVYGLGDGITTDFMTALDVLGHEFTHNINDFTAQMPYQSEHGALDESFCDIMGYSIKHATTGATNWTIGEDLYVNVSNPPSPPIIRSMVNPNVKDNPDTYKGLHWVNTFDLLNDDGGVHTNSGVQNHWFYLLSEGGNGTNDNGDSYSVTGIGIADAQQIAYRNLTTQLSQTSRYTDAYNGSLQAADDLYGNSSSQYSAVQDAWAAVGVGVYCDGVTNLTASTGTFTDGSGNAQYNNNSDCKWLIDVPGATSIDLSFSAFDTEAGFDGIIVYDGNTINATVLDTFSGQSIPPTITSSGSQLLVRFISDIFVSASGWSANYTANVTIYGCTDPSACNYNSNATVNDGSCAYPTSNSSTQTACDSYTWSVNGTTYSTSGTFTDVSTNPAGCTHTETLNLTINSSTSNSTTQTACDSYTWSVDGNTYTTSGTYTHVITSNGCTHTETLILTINNSTSNSTTQSACDSYTWSVNGTTYSTSGTYTDVSTNAAGCTHTETLNLTINSSTSNTTTLAACNSYTWSVNGTTYSTSGPYIDVSTNAAGCTHTENLNLTINNSTSNSTTQSACDSYTWSVNSTTYSTSGTYTDVSTNSAGCTHTETLNLTINSSSSNSTIATACDTYTWSVNGTTYSTSGTYTDVNGCHTETLDLTITNSTSNSTSVTTCDSYTWSVDGNTYTTSGAYTDVSTNANGCDHTETLDLTINNSTSNSTTATACDTYTWTINGQIYTTGGTYTDISTNTAGCTHTETLNLTINNSIISSVLATACDSYNWNGTDYTSSGAYTWNGTNAAGCDSTATLHLTIHNSTTSSEDVISCDSVVWNGTTYTTSGTYDWAGVNAVGCDSIATLNFTGGVTSTITQDEDSLYSSVYPSGVDYSAQWLNIDKETGETWLMGEEKNFGPRFDCNYILVTTTEDGCIDTTDVYFFAEFAGQIYDLKISPNPTRGLINIKYVNERNQFVRIYFANSNGVVLDEFISSENEMNINISNYPSGIYYVYFSSEEHCSSAEQQITRKIILNK